MSGAGSGRWYRLDKKTTVEECRSLDIRKLHRDSLLKPGHRFTTSWSRAGRQIASIGGVVRGVDHAEQVVLLFRHSSGFDAEWKDVQEQVELDWTPATSAG